jgi:hypothetical protein
MRWLLARQSQAQAGHLSTGNSSMSHNNKTGQRIRYDRYLQEKLGLAGA